MNSRLNSLGNLLNGPVLVTGHTGFKGTWLTLLLEELGIEVLGFSLAPEAGSLYDRIGRIGKISEEFADIRDRDSIRNFIERTKPVAVLHLAAQPLVIESYKFPRRTFETNVQGTVNLLDAAFHSEATNAVISITTDKVYRNDNRGLAFKESDPLDGRDPYSASKVGSEAAIAAWQQIAESTGGPKVVAVRAGNVIGGGDWAKDRLIPDLIRGFSQGEAVKIRNPQSTRPWQHALDPLIGYLYALHEVLNGGSIKAMNFGPKEPSMTVAEVAAIVSKCWGASAEVIFEPATDTIYEASKLELNSELASQLLDWTPIWSQESAVKTTTEWWKGLFVEKLNPQELCQKDIREALEKAAS